MTQINVCIVNKQMHDKHKDSSLFPKQGDQNAKRTEKHIDKEQDKTEQEAPRSVKYRGKQNENNIGTIALERSYIYVLRKVGIGTILELSCAKWEFSLCCAIPEW